VPNIRRILLCCCRKGNSIIVTNDDLARWIRQDFPEYRIDASVIKNINNQRKLDQAFTIYDEVVLPMKSNDDLKFLSCIEDKQQSKILLIFGTRSVMV